MSDDKNLPVIQEDTENITPEAQDDYELSRETYRDLMEKGTEALDLMMELARDAEHPRAFEVLGQMIKSTADVTDKLMDLQKKRVEITKNINTNENANNNNPEEGATLKLTTADLQELVMKSIEEDREEVVVIDNDELE